MRVAAVHESAVGALMRPTGRLGRCLFIEVKLTHREHSRHYRPGSVVRADVRMRATVE